MFVRLLRLRPFLWPVPVVVAAYLASFWLERGISYDDGHVGGVVVLVVNTLGFAGLWCARLLFGLLEEPIANPTLTSVILFPAVAAAGSIPYVLMDQLAQRWLTRRSGAADSSSGAG